jgi:hypothetical protein
VIHERIGQAALRAYPPAVRQTRGPEMLGMLLDASEGSNWAFGRETGSLVLGGLRERRAITARAGTRRLIADSCCQAVLIWLTLWIISALNTEAIAGPGQHLLIQEVVLVTILACALIGYERIAAVSGLAAIVAFVPFAALIHTQPMWLVTVLVPIACLLVMARAPRKRPRRARRLLWLLPVGAFAALEPHALVGLPEALALISLGGLLRLPQDPRLAVACSLAWIILLTATAGRPGHTGLGLLDILAVTSAGLMLTLAAGRLCTMRQSATL